MAEIIRRYVGNDYPIKATISKNGDFSLTDKTVIMTFKIGNGTLRVLPGTITDVNAGKVWFYPTAESVADVGVGVYKIDVNDGSYDTTYLKDDIEFLAGVG